MADSTDTTDTTDSAIPDGMATTIPAGIRMSSEQRRVLWLVGVAAAGAIVLLAIWLFRVVSTERTLRAVTSSVTVAAAPAPTVPPAAVPAVPAVPAAPPVLVPPAVPAAPPLPQSPGTPPLPPATVAAAAPESAEARKPVRSVKSKNSKAGAKKEAKRRNTKAARGTFARCPSLGKPGAVMCRWHICNGGAGKEAVCRPYLERRP